ncbi:MAG: RAMP superfamily CRISPR-associated protein, partial [Chloroflexota bacterium]
RRRRGSGQCHFDLNLAKLPATFQSELSLTRPPADLLNGLAELKQIADNTRPFSPSQVLETPSAVVEYSTPTTTNRYIVVAYTEEPIIISSQAEAGNTISSLDYINGTSLRGAIANLFLQQYQSLRVGQLPDRAREIFVALFGKEAVRFSNLLPAKFSLEKDSQMEVGTLQASIPAPRSVFTCKLHRGPLKKATLRPDVPHGLTDYLLDKPIPDHCGYVMDQDKKQECDAALERFSGFLLPGEDSTAWRTPVTLELRYEVVMHNEVDDRTGRAEDGRLFSYKVLQRGQWFAGVIEELEDEGLLGELMAALEIPTGGGEIRVRLGRATRRGQGEVRLRFIPQPFETEADYQPALLVGTSLSERFSRQHKLLTLTLMSDCILQDELLCYLDYLPASYLTEWAGLPKGSLTEWVGLPKDSLTEWVGLPKDSLIEIDEQNQQPMRRYRSTRLVEGWNVAHGLPRETEMAIEAGSVFSYRLLPPALENYDLVLKALQRLE